MVSEKPHIVPIKFHGNPVRKKLLIHSNIVQNAAKLNIFPNEVLKKELPKTAKPLNMPKNAPLPMKTNGISQPKVAASNNKA